MNIEKQFVPIEIAKLLKEKGFDENCSMYVDLNGVCHISYGSNSKIENRTFIPEVWQVVEWLYYEHHIWIKVDCDFITFDAVIIRPDNDPIFLISTLGDMTEYTFTSSKEAYLGAIDLIVKKLI